ncbi:MAG: molecular chaperone DnaJ [Proteobacteria bacterium]|nr:molecular chaperone DnaJ [Pseudomonadota bacterium]
MLQLLLLAILVLLALYGLHAMLKATRQGLHLQLRQAAVWLGLAVLIVLVATGRLGWVAALIGALVATIARLAPLLLQLAPLFQRFRRTGESDEAKGRAGPHASRGMSRDEAYEILGLQPGASRQQVVEAHRRLMQKVHPDRGGSAYLAAKLNQARDLLLAG